MRLLRMNLLRLLRNGIFSPSSLYISEPPTDMTITSGLGDIFSLIFIDCTSLYHIFYLHKITPLHLAVILLYC